MRARYHRDDFVGPDYVGNDTDALTPASEPETDDSNPLTSLDAEVNAIENRRKAARGDGPIIVKSPESPVNVDDTRAIVHAVALQVLLGELDYSERDLRAHYPALDGISAQQIRAIIAEGIE